jgi:hypothetical protein
VSKGAVVESESVVGAFSLLGPQENKIMETAKITLLVSIRLNN